MVSFVIGEASGIWIESLPWLKDLFISLDQAVNLWLQLLVRLLAIPNLLCQGSQLVLHLLGFGLLLVLDQILEIRYLLPQERVLLHQIVQFALENGVLFLQLVNKTCFFDILYHQNK